METPVLNQQGKEVGKAELAEKVFGLKPSAEFLHEVTTIYLANQRQGTAHTKTRADVSGDSAIAGDGGSCLLASDAIDTSLLLVTTKPRMIAATTRMTTMKDLLFVILVAADLSSQFPS